MKTLREVLNMFTDNQILYFYDDNTKILGNSMVKTVREGNSPVVKNLITPVSRIEFEDNGKVCVYLIDVPVPQDGKEYYFRVTQAAEGCSTGYVKMTPEQARFVNKIVDQSNWVLSTLDAYDGRFQVDLDDFKTVEEVENFGDLTSDEDCAEECEEEELNTFGVDCDNCSNTICGHNFCKVYSVPTSFRKGPGYCKYFTKDV